MLMCIGNSRLLLLRLVHLHRSVRSEGQIHELAFVSDGKKRLWSIQDVYGADIINTGQGASYWGPASRERESALERGSRHVLRLLPYHCELNIYRAYSCRWCWCNWPSTQNSACMCCRWRSLQPSVFPTQIVKTLWYGKNFPPSTVKYSTKWLMTLTLTESVGT